MIPNERLVFSHKYHETPQESFSLGAALAGLLITLYTGYYVATYLNFPFKLLREYFWNCVVYIIPARLIFSMDNSGPRQDDSEYAQRRYTAKSDGLKRIFGLKGNIMKGMQGDNTLRGIGMLLKGTKPNTPPGLGNYDNSCYQNSVIQGLAALPSMKAFLSAITIQFPNLLADSTNGALYDTINKLNDPTNHGQRLWTPSKLKSMSSWMQQDAQEYFSKLLDDVDKEIIRSASSINRRSGIEAVSKERGLAPNDEKISAKGMDRDLLQNPLDGLLAQRVGCTRCGYSEGLSMIPFNCLTVPLGRDYLYDIRDCLVEYTDLELIEGVECVKCTLLKTEESLDRLLSNATSENLRNSVQNRLKTVREALDEEDFADNTLVKNCQIPKKNWISSQKSRQAVVARPPKSLVIHVNRSVFDEYTGAQMKNNAQVQFPKTLDMRPWCLGKDLQSTEKKNVEGWSMDPTESMLPSDESLDGLSKVPYELRAVVTHFGRHENGHYVCYRKHPLTTIELKESDLGDEGLEKKSKEPYQTERWWRLSDDDVSPVTEQDVLARGNVFMLFYEQIPLLTKPTEAETETAQLPNDDLVSSSEAAASVPEISTDQVEIFSDESEQDTGDSESELGDMVPDLQTPSSAIGSGSIREILPDLEDAASVALPIYDDDSRLEDAASVALPTDDDDSESEDAASVALPTDDEDSDLEIPQTPQRKPTPPTAPSIPPSVTRQVRMRTSNDFHKDDSFSSLPMVAAT